MSAAATSNVAPEFDLISGEFYANDAHSALTWMREHDPRYVDAKNEVYGVTLREDVMTVSKDAATVCSKYGFRPDSPAMPMMISMDRPEHMTRRGLVNRGFTPRRVALLEPRVREICIEIIEGVKDKPRRKLHDGANGQDEFDFVHEIAAPLPLIVIGDLLGVKEEDHDRLLRWSDDIMCALGAEDPVLIQRQATAAAEWAGYNAAVVADRRSKPPGEDLMSILVHAEVDAERLDDQSILMESLLILIGGDETTRHVISGGMHQLLLHPAQHRKLIGDPSKIPTAVEEMLRWVTPVMQFRRTATCDTQIGNQRIREGDKVVMYYAAANRDPSVFENPERFDITRKTNPHLAFGTGTHFCIGSHMARLEMRLTLAEFIKRFPDFRMTGPVERLNSNFINGIKRMPIALV